MVTEGVTTRKNYLGTCVLLQNPATWGKKDTCTAARRFVITAGHCVANLDAFGNIKIMQDFRLRLPKHPWKGFPQDKINYKHGQKQTNHLYKSIVISKKQIFVHEKYDGRWQSGYDVALIAIPETAADLQSFNFNVYEWGDSYPDSASVNGFPMMTNSKGNVFSHLPYVSSRIRSDNDDDWHFTERKRKGIIEYPLQTKPGISGGAVVVNDCVVAIHNAKNTKQEGHGWGTAFTLELKEWIESKYPEWTSAMAEASKANASSSMVGDSFAEFQEKPVSSWTVLEVAEWLKSIKLGDYAEEFVSEDICGETLMNLDEEMLKDLGMEKKLHRYKFTREMDKLKNKSPNIEDRFKVQGAERWKKSKDINVSCIDVKKVLSSSEDGVKILRSFKSKTIPTPPTRSPPKPVQKVQKFSENDQPNIGDRFKVQGAERWKKSKDINEVVYAGDVNRVFSSSDDGVKIGTLVFDRYRKWYVIKAAASEIYYCKYNIDSQWSSGGLYLLGLDLGGYRPENDMRVFMIDS